MKKSVRLAIFIAATVLVSGAGGASATNSDAGQESREIKAMSPEDVQSYLSGKGMGLAKAAELNGYPGPSHVLALATALELSSEQKRQTEKLFGSMEAKAISLGRPLIEEERKLDRSFVDRTVTPSSLAQSLRRIGQLQAQVREAHMEAHLAQVAILTPEQVARYMVLRGYSDASKPAGHTGHGH